MYTLWFISIVLLLFCQILGKNEKPLLNGQPLLSGHLAKSQGWPLNRGSTVLGEERSIY